MKNRVFLFLTFLLIIAWLTAACNSEIKMVNRGAFGTVTLTPFMPKATFTSVNTPEQFTTDTKNDNSSQTATVDPTLLETTSEITITGEPSTTPTHSLTPENITQTIESTATPTATLKPAEPSDTAEPSATHNPAVPTATAAPTDTPSNTPVQPGDTNTPEPPAATYTTEPSTLTPQPTNTSEPPGCSPSGNSGYESQVISLINKERTDRGFSVLSNNSSLTLAARRHSDDMACNDFFSHTGSGGSTLSSRIIAAGYSYSWAAENIAASSSCNFSAQSVVNMWMNSTGHRNNILSSNAVHIGVGYRCANDGVSNDLDAYYTADFGKP